MVPPTEEPILFLWSLSAWAAKITAYLALRQIPHSRCEQPITQPRPDLAALGVSYRRIPVLSIGRDIYCDTLLILEKLEQLYPPDSPKYKNISCTKEGGTGYALEKLFEKWTDTVVFQAAAAVIPSELDLMKDPGFQRDREELWGRSWGKEEQDRLRPKGLAGLRANFGLLEATLRDGREWITGNEGPSLADIHSCWIFDWLFLLDAYDTAFFNARTYPLTFAWRDRYSSAIDKAKKAAPQPDELSGEDAISQILSSADFQDTGGKLQVETDPEGFKQGDEVEMWPLDTGFNVKDRGRLVKLNASEAVVQRASERDGGVEVRIHYPRWNFGIRRVEKGERQANGEGEDGEFVTLN